MFKIVDSNDNAYIIEYNSGLPTGNFEIDSTENGNFKIFGTGKYNSNQDFWQGTVEIYTEDENVVELKNLKINGKDLFKEKNMINYSWISIHPTQENPVDKNNIEKIIEADVYFNNKLVGKILKGIYQILK